MWAYDNLTANPLVGPLTFATNVRTGELTAYDNYQFLAFGKLGNQVYGLRADGLYALDADDDAGDPIACGFKLHQTNFESPQPSPDAQHFKRVISVYLGIDPMQTATVTTFDDLQRPIATYSGGLRVKLSRGIKAKYWGIEIGNVAGRRLICNAVEFLIDVLTRKVA